MGIACGDAYLQGKRLVACAQHVMRCGCCCEPLASRKQLHYSVFLHILDTCGVLTSWFALASGPLQTCGVRIMTTSLEFLVAGIYFVVGVSMIDSVVNEILICASLQSAELDEKIEGRK